MDYAASTPVDPRVLEEMKPFFTKNFANGPANLEKAGATCKKNSLTSENIN